jgi:hypothetical protein
MDRSVQHENIYKLLRPILFDVGFEELQRKLNSFAIEFIRKEEVTSGFITIQFFDDSIGLDVLQGRILVNPVNHILQRFVNLENNREFYTLNNYDDKERVTQELAVLNMLNKERDINEYAVGIAAHIKNVMLPFFLKYRDIAAINENILNKTSQDIYPQWFHGQSTLKVLIIMRLCKNPKYELYKESKEKEYRSFVARNPKMWQPAYDIFLALTQYLDNEIK